MITKRYWNIRPLELYVLHWLFHLQFRRCLLQLFRCRDQDVTLSKVNPVSDRVTLTNSKNCGEMPSLAAQITVYDRRSEDEHSSCHSFAQLAISENKICPVWIQQGFKRRNTKLSTIPVLEFICVKWLPAKTQKIFCSYQIAHFIAAC